MVLEVIRDGGGRWDTRTIDLELGRRGAYIEQGILADLRELADKNLIEENNDVHVGTGPRWRLTEFGAAQLECIPE
jgi:DNA-binding HxlR family transcriptional regulator